MKRFPLQPEVRTSYQIRDAYVASALKAQEQILRRMALLRKAA